MLDHNHGTHSRKARKVLRGLVAVLITLVWLGISTGQAQTLSIDSQRGELGETVSFNVWVDQAPNDVGAFSFDVTYDPEVLAYKNKVQGELLGSFVFNAVDRGNRVQVAGFSAKEFVAGSSGRLVTLEFEVKNPGDTELAIENLVDHVASWSVQSGFFAFAPPPSTAEQAADSTPQPFADQPKAISPEPELTMAEQLEQQVDTILAEANTLPPTTSRSAAAPTQATQNRGAGALPPPLAINRNTQPAASQDDKSAPAMQEQAAPRPTGLGERRSTPAMEAAVPPQSPQTRNANPTEEAVSESRTSLPGAAPNPEPTMQTPHQQQVAMGDRQVTQAMAQLVPEQPARRSRELVGERSLRVPVDSEAVNRRATPRTESGFEAGFLSQTSRVMLLLFAIALLCVVGAVLIIMKKH
jgi:hypothetical protein